LPEAVNPKTVPKNAIASGSLPYYGWTMTRTARALLKTETLVEEERAEVAIDQVRAAGRSPAK
jgi:hypothetical protein